MGGRVRARSPVSLSEDTLQESAAVCLYHMDLQIGLRLSASQQGPLPPLEPSHQPKCCFPMERELRLISQRQ